MYIIHHNEGKFYTSRFLSMLHFMMYQKCLILIVLYIAIYHKPESTRGDIVSASARTVITILPEFKFCSIIL